MLGWIAIDQFDQDAGVILVEGSQQFKQESRGERREDADLDATSFRSSNRRDIPDASVNLSQDNTSMPKEALPG